MQLIKHTVLETAHICEIVPESVRYLIRNGKLRATKAINGRWLIDQSEIDRLLASIQGGQVNG